MIRRDSRQDCMTADLPAQVCRFLAAEIADNVKKGWEVV